AVPHGGDLSPEEVFRLAGAAALAASRAVPSASIGWGAQGRPEGILDQPAVPPTPAEVAQAGIGSPHNPDPCDTPGCPGDSRYPAPGRGHVEGCKYPAVPSDHTATTEDAAARLAAAEAELGRLCDGGRFIMSIPPREGYDSD